MLRRKTSVAIGLLGLLGLFVTSLCAEPGETVSVHMAWEPGVLGPYTPRTILFSEKPPAGVSALVGLKQPRYARLEMAGGSGLLVAFDADPESPRLWVDSNNDGKLTDEKLLSPNKTDAGFERTQSVLIRYDDDPELTSVELTFRHVPTGGPDLVEVWATAHRLGTVVLGGRLRSLAFMDGGTDLRFDDIEKDHLFLDLDGDGKIAATGQASERIPINKPFRVGVEGWIARVPARSGRLVVFERSAMVPPATTRQWVPATIPPGGVSQTSFDPTLAALTKRFKRDKQLRHRDRYRIVRRIGRVGSEDAFQFLSDIVAKDSDKQIRATAIYATGNAAFLSVGGATVLTWAKKGNPANRSAALYALYYMGHPDQESVLLDAVRRAPTDVVAAAGTLLAYQQSETAANALLEAYRHTNSGTLKYALYVKGIRLLQAGPPPDVMLDAARTSDSGLQAAALEDMVLMRHPKRLGVAFKLVSSVHQAQDTTLLCIRVLGAHGGSKAVAALLDLVAEKGVRAHESEVAAAQLRLLREPESIAAIVRGLRHKVPPVRHLVVGILATIRTPSVGAALLKQARREKDQPTLLALLEALGNYQDPAVVRFLLRSSLRPSNHNEATGAVRRMALRSLVRGGAGDARVQKFLLGLLSASEDEDRIIALRVARTSTDQELVPAIAKNLGHAAWPVRLSAIETLGALRRAAGVAPLIELLGSEQRLRLREAASQALFRITGQNLYDNAVIWADWWSKNESTFSVPLQVPKKQAHRAGATTAGFYGIPVRTRQVVFVLDQSASMSASGMTKAGRLTRLNIAVRELLGAVARLEDRVKLNVILFNTKVHPWQDRLRSLTKTNRAALRAHLISRRPTGGTNIYDPLEQALLTKGVDTVFLLSDGVSGSGQFVSTPDILHAVRRINRTRMIAIHCVSIGVESRLLKKLAAEHSGTYVRR